MSERVDEVYTTLLARAAGKSANNFLHKRGLQKADRDDVISAALVWCLENKANYSLTTTLETWFMNAVRDAYKNLRYAELPASDESVDSLLGEDTTYNNAATESAAEALVKALTPKDQEITALVVQGYTRREIEQLGYSQKSFKEANQRVKQLRRLLPDRIDAKFMARGAPTGSSDDEQRLPSWIDREIEQLDFAPPSGKDCPPCWRCMWFEGYMPAGKRDTRLEIVDPEVSEAVKSTEARKIEIAQAVRDSY